jgi:Na+/proline symporter
MISISVLAQTAALPAMSRPTVAVIAIGYLAVCLAIAVATARRTRDPTDFYLAGRSLGMWPLAIASMAATLSGFAFIGGPGLVHSLGTGAMFIVLPAALTGALTAWALARPLRLLGEVRGLVTVPAAIGARYRSPAAQGLSAIAILVAVVGYLATNLLALGLVINAVFGAGLGWGIVIGTAVVVAYSASGGILAGIYADLFQGSVMAVASAAVFMVALESGAGLASISRTILEHDPGWFGPWGKLSPVAALSFFFVFGMGAVAQPHVAHKFYMLKDPRRLRWYPMVMTAAMLVTLLLYFGVGVSVTAQVIAGTLPPLSTPDHATPVFLLHNAPGLLAGIVFSGVAAAIMSTVNSFLNIGAAALTHDLPAALGRPASPHQLRNGRRFTVVLALLAAALAAWSGVLVAVLGIFGFSLFASTLVPALAIGLNWPGATKAGALASISVGLVGGVALELLVWSGSAPLPNGVTASGLTLVASLLTFFGVSWLTRKNAPRDLDPDVALVMRR